MKKLIAVAAIVPVIAVVMAGSAASHPHGATCRAVGTSQFQTVRCVAECKPGEVAECKNGGNLRPPSCKCTKTSE